jgi:peptidyl-prolyl cis-trans isomerase-like 4
MSVLLETSLGDIVIDLFTEHAPLACTNFLKLCKLKYFNNCLFFDVQQNYLTLTGDPTNSHASGTSVWGILSKENSQRYFKDEKLGVRRFNKRGLVGMASKGPDMNASQFFITLGEQEIRDLHKKHTMFG